MNKYFLRNLVNQDYYELPNGNLVWSKKPIGNLIISSKIEMKLSELYLNFFTSSIKCKSIKLEK